MVSHRYSFRSAHLVMWSSPLLLLVLVFTLTNSTKTPASSAPAHHTSQPTSPTTSVPVATTSRATVTTVAKSATTTTSAASVAPYADTTSSIARSVALAPSANASSGALEGILDRSFPVADVPLQGPGSWTLTTSAATRSLLACSAASSPVATRVVIKISQSCQLEITSSSPGVSQTWQLIPTP